MPRIYKGSENTLKLLVHTCDPDTIDNLKIVLFTDDPNSAAEFYFDSITIEGNIASLKVNAWSFDNMNEGVINYIASGELGNDTFLTERQSNYYLKSPNNYTPTTPDFDNYYTKEEVDDMLKDIEVDVDLEGYATEEYVNGKVEGIQYNFVSGDDIKTIPPFGVLNLKTINGEAITGNGDITIEGGGSGSSEDAGTYILEWVREVNTREYWVNPETGEEEDIIPQITEDYNNSEERKTHNKEVIDAILAGKCKTLYYKFLCTTQSAIVETDENGREHRKLVDYYNYIPMSWVDFDIDTYTDEYIVFSGKYNFSVYTTPAECTFKLNIGTGERDNFMENGYVMGSVTHSINVYYNNNYTLNRAWGQMACDDGKPVKIYINDENDIPSGTILSGRNDWNKESVYAWCIDENANFYLWTFEGNEVWETTPTITNLKTEPVDLTPYYTKNEIDQLLVDLDLTDYYTKAETDELIANINLGDSSTISSIVSTEVSNQLTDNFKTINGESIIGEGDIVIEGGTDVDLTDYYTKTETDAAISEGKRIGILECVEQLYDFNNDAWIQYGEDDRQSHNATVIQNALDGVYDIVVYKHFFEQANSQNIFIYVPLTFRYPSHDGYFRATGLLETNEYTGSSSAKLIHMMMSNDGTIGSFGVDDVNLLSSGGGSSSGVPDYTTITYPTLVSPIINGEMQFQEDYGPYTDTANGIACGYKMKRAVINDLWTQNLHLGNDTDDSTIKIGNYAVEDDMVVYHEITKTGIKENGTYLSEKYASLSVIGDINSILATI